MGQISLKLNKHWAWWTGGGRNGSVGVGVGVGAVGVVVGAVPNRRPLFFTESNFLPHLDPMTVEQIQ